MATSKASAGARAPSRRAVVPGHRATVPRREDMPLPQPSDIGLRPTFSVDLTHLLIDGLEATVPADAQPG